MSSRTDDEWCPMNVSNDMPRELTESEREQLALQDSRRVSTFRASKFCREPSLHWDKFYLRNTTKFFKDRHWTLREFRELTAPNLDNTIDGISSKRRLKLMEIGCGVGNFVFPLLDELDDNIFIYACDFSPRAVQHVKDHALYDERRIKAFVLDITRIEDSEKNEVWNEIKSNIEIVSCVFVLSALTPSNFSVALNNFCKLLRPGGIVLFRDYAINDMAMIRFSKGTKIDEQHYLRQDGTTSYFFQLEQVRLMFTKAGFQPRQLSYVHRKTINRKEGIDAARVFVQGVFVKT